MTVQKAGDINKRLWYMLAEPSKLSRDGDAAKQPSQDRDSSTKFWKTAINNAHWHYKNSQDMDDLKALLLKNWKNLTPILKHLNLLGEEPVPLLLFVFDEARALVKMGLGGKVLKNEGEVSRFRILRRAIRQVGISKEPIRILTVFTDTTSKISNFQLSIAPRSFRKTSRAQQGNDLFAPIVILPTFDYHANYRLQITGNPMEVARPERLFCFGRAAWFSMLESGTPYKKLVSLAETKLTRRDADSLRKLFQSDPLDDETRLVMLALMGTRLALQTGSFTALLPEMVSSHMMVLMRVSDDHEQLEAFYPSEPILANASSNITAVHGWTRPCQAMVSLFRHGMVVKGFRGEYVTKTICCIAFEDACREMKEKAERDGEGSDGSILWYSRPVPLFLFLDRLLRNPLTVRPPTDDDDNNDGNNGDGTLISSTLEGSISSSHISGRTEIPEVDEGQVEEDAQPDIRRKRERVDDISEGSRESKTPKKANPTYDDPIDEPTNDLFDDSWSDEEDIPDLRGEDRVPAGEETSIHEYFLKTLSEWHDLRPQTKKATKTSTKSASAYERSLRDLDVLHKKGHVFITHWVTIRTELRPSILIKAWNRGAGIVTKANTEGIDFVIPVMLSETNPDNNCFGPLFGRWTVEQEKAATRAVSYILLKNDASLSDNDITLQAIKCAPSASSFRFHAPMNPFVTIIASYATSDLIAPVKLVRNATLDTEPHQFSVSAQGLSGSTFKCLEGRPNLTRILKTVLEMDRNPLRGSGQAFEGFCKTTRDYYHLATHPAREFNLFGVS